MNIGQYQAQNFLKLWILESASLLYDVNRKDSVTGDKLRTELGRKAQGGSQRAVSLANEGVYIVLDGEQGFKEILMANEF